MRVIEAYDCPLEFALNGAFTPMSDKLMKVECRLEDCMYYRCDPIHHSAIYCGHLEKPHYASVQPCPLYRLDWQKKAAAGQGLLKKFSKF
jgi:hypothetical protein